jgi:hypothetical protein
MLVDEPIEAVAEDNLDEEVGASLVEDDDSTEESTEDSEDTQLSENEQEILAFVREKNLDLSTLRQFDAFEKALRAKAVKMNTLMPGASRDFNTMSISELQTFVADRVALGKNAKLLGHTEASSSGGEDFAEEKLTPGELLKGNNK